MVTFRSTCAELLQRFVRSCDEAAFELLVWRHGAMVLNLCRRVLRHEQDVEDAFQATFLIFVRKAGSIAKRQSVGSWLYKVAYRLALRARADSARRARREQQVAEQEAVESGAEVIWRDRHAVYVSAAKRGAPDASVAHASSSSSGSKRR